jgi:cysteine desulfurase
MPRMSEQSRVYLDYAATTPLDPDVWEAMAPFFQETFGNPSSGHYFGQLAEGAVEDARRRLAARLGCRPEEIIFTSGGSESDNLALRGIALAARRDCGASHILTTPVEHPAVRKTAAQLADAFGFECELLPVDQYGMVDPEAVRARLRKDTALVSVIHACNEIGTIQPIAEIGEVCRARGVPLHTDSVQAAVSLDIRADALPADLLSISAHKFHGPKGVGALYVRTGLGLLPSQTGGGQEGGRRAGTSNVPLIVGMSAAYDLTCARRAGDVSLLLALRDRLIAGILACSTDIVLTGHPTQRLPHIASFAIHGVKGNHLLMQLDLEGFAVSSGSACKTGDPQPSEVLLALGLTPAWAQGSLRVTVGRSTSAKDIERFLAVLPGVIEKRRALDAA